MATTPATVPRTPRPDSVLLLAEDNRHSPIKRVATFDHLPIQENGDGTCDILLVDYDQCLIRIRPGAKLLTPGDLD